MANVNVGQQPDELVEVEEPLEQITDSLRRVGADAAAEQRELLCILLEQHEHMSGFAVRGLLMRVLDLSEVTSDLFEGNCTEPLVLVSKVYGMTEETFRACELSRKQSGAARQDMCHG